MLDVVVIVVVVGSQFHVQSLCICVCHSSSHLSLSRSQSPIIAMAPLVPFSGSLAFSRTIRVSLESWNWKPRFCLSFLFLFFGLIFFCGYSSIYVIYKFEIFYNLVIIKRVCKFYIYIYIYKDCIKLINVI